MDMSDISVSDTHGDWVLSLLIMSLIILVMTEVLFLSGFFWLFHLYFAVSVPLLLAYHHLQAWSNLCRSNCVTAQELTP